MQTLGSQVVVKIVKNKLAPPFKNAQFELEFGKGICRESELIDLGIKHKFITKSGSFYNMNGENFHGKDALKRFLSRDDSAREELTKKLREKLLNVETEKATEAESTDEGTTEEVVSGDSTEEESGAAVEV